MISSASTSMYMLGKGNLSFKHTLLSSQKSMQQRICSFFSFIEIMLAS